MKSNIRTLAVLAAVLILTALACNLPTAGAPTPIAFPTPDLTLTAIYSPLTTPSPPAVITATPVQLPGTGPEASPTPTLPPLLGTFIPGTPLADSPQPPTPTVEAATPTPQQRLRPGPLVEAAYLHTPPTIDGNLGEWNQPLLPADHVSFGFANWSGSSDLSARFMIGWDYNYLYIAARVTDDVYVQIARNENIFLGDSLEILFDTNLAQGFDVTTLGNDNYQLGISPGHRSPGNEPEAYQWYPRHLARSREGVRIGARGTADGYEVEAAIPWSIFEMTPQAELAYGFVFSVSDNDQPGEMEQESMVSNVSGRRLTNPTTWGNLILKTP
jgi:hypothetical protein